MVWVTCVLEVVMPYYGNSLDERADVMLLKYIPKGIGLNNVPILDVKYTNVCVKTSVMHAIIGSVWSSDHKVCH